MCVPYFKDYSTATCFLPLRLLHPVLANRKGFLCRVCPPCSGCNTGWCKETDRLFERAFSLAARAGSNGISGPCMFPRDVAGVGKLFEIVGCQSLHHCQTSPAMS